MISLVVAHDEQRAIGYNGWMPWNLPEDLKCFKQITLHQKIVMGRVTFSSLKKPLADRFTYVVTKKKDYVVPYDNVCVVEDFIALLEEYKKKKEILFVCGGALIYEQALPYVDEMWISLVDGKHPADTYFPAYNKEEFNIESKQKKDGFTLLHYVRK